MKRRNFLAATAGGVVSAPFIVSRNSSAWAASKATSPIAICVDNRASGYVGRADGTDVGTYTVNAAVIASMVDAAVMRLSGQSTVGAAWESIIRAKVPGLTPSTRIGIKINTSYAPGTDSWQCGYAADERCPYMARGETVQAVVAGLRQMLGGTYNVANVTAFDRLNQPGMNTYMPAHGFPAGGSANAYDVGGSNGQYRCVVVSPGAAGALSGDTFTVGPFSSRNTTTTQNVLSVVKQQTVWINIGIPKVNIGAGITGVLKNTYGMTNNCGGTHPIQGGVGDIIHDGVPRFYQALSGKVPCALNILDGLAGNYALQVYAGPSFVANAIAMSVDPVTIDYYAAELVNAARVANGWAVVQLAPIGADRYSMQGAQYCGTVNDSPAKRDYDTLDWTYSTYVNFHGLAIAEQLGLGNLNSGERLSAVPVGVNAPLVSLDKAQGRPVALSRSGTGWRLGVQFDRSGRAHTVRSSIVDMNGREVRGFGDIRTSGERAVIDWDGRAHNGVTAARGVYSWVSYIDGMRFNQTVVVR